MFLRRKNIVVAQAKLERKLPLDFLKWAGKEKWVERSKAQELVKEIGAQNTVLFAEQGGNRNAGIFLYNSHPADIAFLIKKLGKGNPKKGVMLTSALVRDKMGANTKGGIAVDAAEFLMRFRPDEAAKIITTFGVEKVRTNMTKLLELKRKETKTNSQLTSKMINELLK